MIGSRKNHLRPRGKRDHARVTYVELFFDLVFVFAVTQLSHGLLEHLTPLGAVQTGLLMMGMWWVWIYTSWITNWLDPDLPAVRLMLFALMAAGLVLSASIPEAFAERGMVFAVAYVFMQVGRSIFMLWTLRHHDAANYRNFLRITVWLVLAAVFWIAGALVEGRERLGLWALAVGIEYLSPALGMWVPGLGRSKPEEWKIDGSHLAERCAGFIILALGESVLVTGATFSKMPWQSLTALDFSANFIGIIAMWTLYFNIGSGRASRLIEEASDPGRLGRSGYTYLHILIVAGIIVTAVADQIALEHPSGEVDLKTVLVMVGGPALYLLGMALFKRLTAPNLPLSHLVGLGLLALLASTAAFATPFLLTAGTSAILVLVAAWEWVSFRPRRRRSPAHGH